MYRAIELARSDRYLHRFVWRSNPNVPLTDHRMTCVTFGVSSSLFAANMAVKQNAIDHAQEFPFAAEIARKCFYVDDCLTGADDPKSALTLQQQLTSLFARGGFLLRKWNSRKSPRNSETLVMSKPSLKSTNIPRHLVLNQPMSSASLLPNHHPTPL